MLPPREEDLPLPRTDPDVSEVMGCFASPKRFGHHGPISDVSAISYESANVRVESVAPGNVDSTRGRHFSLGEGKQHSCCTSPDVFLILYNRYQRRLATPSMIRKVYYYCSRTSLYQIPVRICP